MNKVFLQMHW